MKNKTISSSLVSVGMFVASIVGASGGVVANYNFNGRVNATKAVRRDKVDGPLTVKGGIQYGPEYIPNKEQGESGPKLENPYVNAKVPKNYYRSYYFNDNERDVLKLQLNHVFYADRYKSVPNSEGKGIIPGKGPFAIEMVLCVDGCRGVTSGKMRNITTIIDLSIDKSKKLEKKYIWNNKLFAYNFNKAKQSWNLAYSAGKDQYGHSKLIECKGLNAKQYYHIALIYDESGNVKLYVDGKVVAETKVPVNAERNTCFSINDRMTFKGLPPGLLVGKIDGLVIYNSTISPDQFTLLKKQD